MAAVLRKRKIIDTGFGDAAQQQPRIQHFGRLTKPGVRRSDKATTTTRTKISADAGAPLAPARSPAAETKKRKIEHTTTTTEQAPQRPVTPPPPSAPVQRTQKARLPPSKPGEPRRIAPLKKQRARGGAAAGGSVAESPTQGARAILEAFVLAAPAPKTPAETIHEQRTKHADESQELLSLHAAFLNALSLHYAHEGTSTPADLRQLALSIARIWGRRRVSTEDIRRVLGVQQWKTPARNDIPTLLISDFGRDRICIEYEPSATAPAHAAPLPVAALKTIFAGNLLALGATVLPLAPITPFVSLTTSSASATGAARLADLKASALNAQANAARAEGRGLTSQMRSHAPPASSSSSAKPSSRGASLLARICAKEQHAASLPAAPTPAAAQRTAALQRLEEIIPVIEILASRNGGGSRSGAQPSAASMDLAASLGLGPRTETKTVSFTMPALVQHLQNSLRHPLAKEEGERCVHILASEVLPRWVQVHTLNKWTSVSIRGSVRRGEWVERIRELLEEEEK